jgi:hypothetical protein
MVMPNLNRLAPDDNPLLRPAVSGKNGKFSILSSYHIESSIEGILSEAMFFAWQEFHCSEGHSQRWREHLWLS